MKLRRAFSMKKTNNIYPKSFICTAMAVATFSMMMPAFAIVYQDNNTLLDRWQINNGFNNTIVGGGGGGSTQKPYNPPLDQVDPDKPDDTGSASGGSGSGSGSGNTGTGSGNTGNGSGYGGNSLPNVTGGNPTELEEPAANDPGYNIPTKNGINYRIKQ